MLSSLPHIWFMLLVNIKSGGGWGKRYLQLKKHQFAFQYKKSLNVHLHLIDLCDQQKISKCLKKIKDLQRSNINDIRIIICGGDGTIIWGIEECFKAGLELSSISFGCLPIGTGNDFSRTLGWGSNPLQFSEGNMFHLKKRTIEWIRSTIKKYDVWEVQASVYEKGSIYTVKNGQELETGKKVYKTGFVNYVGIGIDARISYNFEKNRKSSKLMNLAVYGCLGCFFCCHKIPELSSALKTFEQTDPENASSASNILKSANLDNGIDKLNEKLVSRKISLKKGYHGLVCLNSISYMAGATHAWKTKKIGCIEKQAVFHKQQFNDGKIEFIAYKNQFVLGLQKIMHTGAKVAQGQGPFEIQFKQEDAEIKNYIQIDGQGLMIKAISEVSIRRHPKIPQINVMVHQD